MICEQNGKIEDTENFKRIQKGNFGAEKFSKWNEKLTGRFKSRFEQQKKDSVNWRQAIGNYWGQRTEKKKKEKQTTFKGLVGTPLRGPTYASWESQKEMRDRKG